MAESRRERQPVALVTGISRGFGKAVAGELLANGWIVVGDARNAEALQRLGEELNAADRLVAIPGDIRDVEHLAQLVETASSRGAFRLLVNNAGGLGPSPLPPISELLPEDLSDLFELNTVAQLRLIQLALPVLENPGAVVINVTSDAAVEPYEGWGCYGATKAALDRLTAGLAAEQKDAVFYALDPGDMNTEMHQAAFPGEDISDRNSPEVSAPAITRLAAGDLPAGRYRAEDILARSS